MWQETIIEFDKLDKQGDIFQSGCFDLTKTDIALDHYDGSAVGIVRRLKVLGNKLMTDMDYTNSAEIKNALVSIGFTIDDFEMSGDVRLIKKATIHAFIIVRGKAARIY